MISKFNTRFKFNNNSHWVIRKRLVLNLPTNWRKGDQNGTRENSESNKLDFLVSIIRIKPDRTGQTHYFVKSLN